MNQNLVFGVVGLGEMNFWENKAFGGDICDDWILILIPILQAAHQSLVILESRHLLMRAQRHLILACHLDLARHQTMTTQPRKTY